MDAIAILDRLQCLGVKVTVSGERLRLEPGSRVPLELVEELKAHKMEVISTLKLKGYRIKYPEAQASEQELAEIAERVQREGYVLLWSTVLQDLIAFYRDEEARSNIPTGFVPYSEAELKDLHGGGKLALSSSTLKLIHEAKKRGGRVVDNEAIQ